MTPKMTHRQRAITAITGGVPDRVPTFELVFHETERDFGGRTFFGQPFEPDSTGMSYTDIVKYNAQLYVDIARRYDHSIIFIGDTLHHHERGGKGPDPWAQGMLDMTKAVRDIAGDEFLVMNHNDPTFGIPWDAMEEFCYALYEDPAAMHAKARANVEGTDRMCDKMLAAGSDGFIMCADYCTNDGPFISPSQFSEFVAPYLKEAVANFKSRSAYVIKHTDGNIMPIIDDLVDAAPSRAPFARPDGES